MSSIMIQQVDVVNQSIPTADPPTGDEVMEAVHAVMHAFRSRQHQQLRGSASEVNPMEIRALRYFARHPGATQRDSLYLAVPAKSEGVSVVGDWDPLGMRGTVSRNLHFKDVFVSDDEQLMPRGIYFKGAQTDRKSVV